MSLLMIETHPLPAPALPTGPEPAATQRGLVASAADPMVLFEALRPEVNLAIWHRPLPAEVTRPLASLMAHAPFCLTAEDTPERAVDALAAELPALAPVDLLLDIQRLAIVFATLIGRETVGMRLEAITGRACHRWHADAVGLRLLTTYRGAGTEWLALGGGRDTARALGEETALPPGVAQGLPAGAVALLKGEGYPGNAGWGCIHRSPPAARGPRARLLLCLDEPGRIPRA
jgi:hypothetical protein